MKPHVVLFAVALAASALVVSFVVSQPETPAVSAQTQWAPHAHLTDLRAIEDLKAEIAALKTQLTSLASVQPVATITLPEDHAPAVQDDPAAGASLRLDANEFIERVEQRMNQRSAFIQPPPGLIVPPKLQPVSFTLPAGHCGHNGCGVASQSAIIGRGVPVVRQARQWRPFGGRFRRGK